MVLTGSSLFASPCEDVTLIQNRQYFPALHQALKEAHQSIRVMMYSARYYRQYPDSPSNILIQDLVEAAKRGVEVKVILELGIYEEVNRDNREVARLLSKEGIAVALDSPSVTTHAKTITIDGDITILGSTNWKYYSLDRNNEVSVLIRSRELAGEMEAYFDNLWRTSHPEIVG